MPSEGGWMRRYIVTGAPGAGKTAVVRELKTRGYAVVEEAATDIIAWEQLQGHNHPWAGTGFVDEIIALQRQRQEKPVGPGTMVQIYDRSPICTLALAHYGGRPVTSLLAAEIERVVRERIYERRVFFVRPIGFVTATAARRITFEQSLEFERLHEQAYRACGYEIVNIPRGEIAERAAMIDQYVQSWLDEAAR
jgi:predicted ATPase